MIAPGFRPHTRLRFSPYQVLVAGFAFIILFGGILLSLPIAAQPGKNVGFLNALFTANSAVCVTGLVVKDTYTTFSTFGQIVILLLIQVGGLGFMTTATLFAVIMGRKILLRERMLLQEALNRGSMEGVVRIALYVLKVTAIFELSGALILTLNWSKQMGWGRAAYFGVFHAVSAFNNAGFDLFGNFNSLTSQVGNIPVNLVISALIIFGGLGFAVILELQQIRSWRKMSLHSKIVLVTTGGLLIIGFLGFALLEWQNPGTLGGLSTGKKLLASMFQAVTPRTAGFNTVDLSKINSATSLFIVILMFIGASPGSTGGGIKTTTLAATLVGVWSLIKGKSDYSVGGRRLNKEQVYKGVVIAFLATVLIVSVAIMVSAIDHLPIADTLFEATSAFGTVGLSLGITPALSPLSKIIIMFTMFAGRLGPLTLALALGRSGSPAVRYPEEKIIIG